MRGIKRPTTKKKDRRDRFNWSADQCRLVFPLTCDYWCFSDRPIEPFHSILWDLWAARTAPVSIGRPLYGAWTQRPIFLDRRLIFCYLVGPWNGALMHNVRVRTRSSCYGANTDKNMLVVKGAYSKMCIVSVRFASTRFHCKSKSERCIRAITKLVI